MTHRSFLERSSSFLFLFLILSHAAWIRNKWDLQEKGGGILIWQRDLSHQLGEKFTETFREISCPWRFLQDPFYPFSSLTSTLLHLAMAIMKMRLSDLQLQEGNWWRSSAAALWIHHLLSVEAMLPTVAPSQRQNALGILRQETKRMPGRCESPLMGHWLQDCPLALPNTLGWPASWDNFTPSFSTSLGSYGSLASSSSFRFPPTGISPNKFIACFILFWHLPLGGLILTYSPCSRVGTPWGFPGGPGVKNLPWNAGDLGSIPGWGTRIPHAEEQLSLRAATAEPAHHN